MIDLVDFTTYSAYDSLGYTVDDAGNITAIDDWLNSTYSRSYDHDDLDRLIWDSGPTSASPTYSYDGNGNRLTRAAGTYAAQSFTYSPGSNRQAGISDDGMGNDLTNAGYDDSGRLSTVSLPNSDTLGLYYNGFGDLARTRLSHRDACNNEILLAREDFSFAPDGRALTVNTTNTVAVNVDYIWLDQLPVAQFQDSYDSTGTYIATETTYLHPDHLGTPRIGTDAARNITWRYRSDAFGIAPLSGTATVRLRFPGQLNLGAEGFNYNYFRDYRPDTGRYLESDPIGLVAGINTYGYVEQNPLSFIDPLGLAAACGDDQDCIARCLKAYYGDFYTFALAASPLSLTGFALDEVAEATETSLSRQANRALYGLSTQSYEKGKRLLRTLKQFRGFNAANQVLGAGALGFVVGAQSYCRFQCQSD